MKRYLTNFPAHIELLDFCRTETGFDVHFARRVADMPVAPQTSFTRAKLPCTTLSVALNGWPAMRPAPTRSAMTPRASFMTGRRQGSGLRPRPPAHGPMQRRRKPIRA